MSTPTDRLHDPNSASFDEPTRARNVRRGHVSEAATALAPEQLHGAAEPFEEPAIQRAAPVSITGIAWDGGYGIRAVEVSVDGGKTWIPAALGQDFGKFAFRAWSRRFVPKVGKQTIVARATNAIGQTQTADLIINPGGYHHNVMHAVTLIVT